MKRIESNTNPLIAVVIASIALCATHMATASYRPPHPPPPPEPEPIILVKGSLAFGNVGVGSTATRTITIANEGDAPLIVYGFLLPNGYSGSWRGSIAPGQSTQAQVTFSPNRPGPFNYGVYRSSRSSTSTTASASVGFTDGLIVLSNAKTTAGARLAVSGYGVTARPDGLIRLSSRGWSGDNVYNTGGRNQTQAADTRESRRRTKKFFNLIQNDGPVADTLTVRGSRGGSKFDVRYYHVVGTRLVDVTSLVTNGTFRIPNAPPRRNAGLLRLDVKAKKRATAGSQKTCLITTQASAYTPITDTVRAIVRVNRG